MKFTVCNAEQRSDEWFAARLGRLTGSKAADMMAKIKTGEAAARRDYRMQLVCERLTGNCIDDGYVNKEMQRGIDLEPEMLAAWEAESGLLVRRTGFLSCDDVMAGCSVDGDVENFTGIIEGKCPKQATHLRYIREGRYPPEYVWQGTNNLWVSGAKWIEFVSFDDRFPPELQLFRVRAYREEFARELEEYERAARLFLVEVDRETEAVRALMRKRAA